MIGTIINTALILLGTALGLLLRRGIPERVRTALMSAMGLATVLIGLKGAMGTNDTLCVILCLAFGGALGSALNLELRLEHFGNWIEKHLGNGKEQGSIAKGFVTATLVYCVGAMAIVLAVVMASAGITFTTKLIEQAKACPDKAPTIARYADKLNPSMALLSFYTCTENKEDVDLMTNELTALMKDMEKTAPAAAEAPAVNAESTQG